jgi:hypothetical protein
MANINFTHAKKKYQIVKEVSSLEGSLSLTVRVMLNGKPASPYCYAVTEECASDIKTMQASDVVKAIVSMAKDDVIQNRWQNFLAAVNTLKKRK